MPYWYRGQPVGNLDFDSSTPGTSAYHKVASSGFFREYGSKAPLMDALTKVSRDLPIGTEMRIEKIYHMKRGYEPDAPFRHGQVAEEVILKLVDHGTWYDPKTGKARPAKWDVVKRSSRKSSLDEWTTKNKVVVRDASGVVRAKASSLAAAHRATRRANMAGTSVSKTHNMAERHGVRLTGLGKKYGHDITLTEWICELREELQRRGITDDAIDDFIQQRGKRLKQMWRAGEDRYDVANNVDEALGRSGYCEDCGDYH